MRRLLGTIAAVFDVRDICGVLGFGLLVFGVHQLQREAGFIVAGTLLLAFAIAAARK